MELMKNIPFSEALDIGALVDYEEGRVVSRTLAQKPTVNVTLFAFDSGEGISSHSSPGDAFVHILDGEAQVTVGGLTHTVSAGQCIAMPANVPHGLEAEKQFKMMLVVVKPEK
ncbi:cupin domain-containing protein [Desulfovibrio ferrophilus]|uniref:Cupin n=1 Tax=Desulfovibrio ferrophilus TaxID=241368 RepID=A0A2Z6B365_9BACT|nr:cupin domain-containing protein [Desulfovibrio ferrophilus]BBD09856.1 cupin [Desulfovibrio ferrophilus]